MESLIELIHTAFAETEYPGDDFLVGSRDGSEPGEVIAPFIGVNDWREMDAGVLDRHSEALSFLSEGGFRFFLPAYLVADLRGLLLIADPVFPLTHGFSDGSVTIPVGDRTFTKTFGGSTLLNPRRYGAMTFHDHARYRLAVFTREEAAAIVAYLEHRKADGDGIEADTIDAALDLFWRARATEAPDTTTLAHHLQAERELLAAFEDDATD